VEHEEALAAAGEDVRAREPLQVAGDLGLGIARGGDVAFAGEERLDSPPPDRLGQHGGAPRDRFEGGVGPRVLRAIFPQKQSGGAGFRSRCAREAAGSLPLAVGRVSLPPMSPATFDSPDAAPALRRYLEAMPRFVRERGSDYARPGRVESVARRSEREVEGAVRCERLYTVRLQRAGNHWMGVCTCPLGSRCKHLHALGLAWLGKLAPEPVAPPTGNELPAEREALLLREFTAGRTAPLAPAGERLARKILRVGGRAHPSSACQAEPVIAYRLVTRGTVEEKIRRLQAEKAALAGSVVPDGETAAPLNLDTLREILA